MQLHVSFGVVRSRCRCALKKAFLYRLALHELKKFAIFAHQKFSVFRQLTNRPQKPLVFASKTPLVRTTFYCPQKPPFLRTKTFLLHKPSLAGFKNHPFSQTQSLSFAQTFPYSHQKQSFSTLRCPFQPPLTYCLQRIQLFF